MSHGGARKGAGRPDGKNTKISRTQELIAKATQGGVTPLEVLVNSMRFYHEMAEDAVEQFRQSESAKQKAKLFRIVNQLKSSAKDYATAAASYIHPKLNAISAPDGGPIQAKIEIVFV